MANFVTARYAHFVAPTTATASSSQSSFPATNVLSVTTPNTPWKGTATISTSDWVLLNFGAATSLAAIVIDHTNAATLTLKGKATDTSWGSPSWTSGALTVSEDEHSGRRKLYHVPTGTGSPFNYQYLRIECGVSTSTDGSSNWRIGSVLCVSTISTWDTNTGFPHGPEAHEAVDDGLKAGGGGEPTSIGNRYAHIVLPTSTFTGSTQLQIWKDLLSQSRADPLMYYRNNGDDSEVYICHRLGVVRGPSLTAPNAYEIQSVVLREVV
ncbi:MAG: hypothetical protein AB7I42_22695 [Bradyrhizobium sp.]|uniref:hypothetical protein n=1 Tax=Bradyrhizobium sp. TaxID=376 RepID=UPI003D0DF847